MSDTIYMARNGQQLGPYTREQLTAMAAAGEILPGDMAWHVGMAEWTAADSVLRGLGIAVAPPPRAESFAPPPGTAAPQSTAGDRNLAAGLGLRWLASFLDGLLLGVVGFVVIMVFFGAAHPDGKPHFGFLPLLYLIQIVYFTVTQAGSGMASLGKRATGMIVVNRQGQPLGYPVALARYLILLITSFFFLPLLLVLFMPRRQGLHDLIMNTVVIERSTYDPQSWDYENIRNSPRGGGPLLVVAIGVVFVVFVGGILAAIAIPAYQDYLARARVLQAYTQALPVEARVGEQLAKGGAPVQYSDVGLDGPKSLPQNLGLLTMDPQGTLTVTLGFPPLRGQSLVLTPTVSDGKVSWQCSGGELKPQYLPRRCR
jgi:uncharacterized RDD family membrane protein YckC/type II secretory pathway pseudopilin PulG